MTDLDKRIDAYLALADAAPKGPYRKHGPSIYSDETEEQPDGRIALCEGNKYWRPKTAAFLAASPEAAQIIRELRAERDALIHDMDQLVQAADAEAKYADELKAERDALRADAERGAWLNEWLKRQGLLVREECRINAGEPCRYWWLFWPAYGIDRRGVPAHADTDTGAIDAARAQEKSGE